MPKYESNNEQLSNGVNLLVSILIRYPEIGTASFDPQNHCLKLKFMLSAVPAQPDFSATKQLLLDSIAAYHVLESLQLKISEILLHTHDQVAMISIVRDVHTISKGEISLIITILRDKLEKYLITDYNDSLAEEDLLVQEEVIEEMLENIIHYRTLHGIIGIRENGRVLIFNK
ncbi:MAG: hypothetical protein H7X79_11790 [Sporomusaceae bacterium]|nr:hypothetical protein [Sporomusaceae bacterium]